MVNQVNLCTLCADVANQTIHFTRELSNPDEHKRISEAG